MTFHKICKSILLLSSISICILLTGCGSRTIKEITPEIPPADAASYQVGKRIIVQTPGNPFVIQDLKDALAYDGMYYASWTIGESIPYTNADDKQVELFDAQLYMLTTESSSAEADKNMQNWLATAKENYQITEESTFSNAGIEYHLVSYDCKEDNPYNRGISAFASCKDTAICIEFTARDTFADNISNLMEHFLSGCSYSE